MKTIPAAWIGPLGQLMPHVIYEAWAPAYPEDAKHFEPLFRALKLNPGETGAPDTMPELKAFLAVRNAENGSLLSAQICTCWAAAVQAVMAKLPAGRETPAGKSTDQ